MSKPGRCPSCGKVAEVAALTYSAAHGAFVCLRCRRRGPVDDPPQLAAIVEEEAPIDWTPLTEVAPMPPTHAAARSQTSLSPAGDSAGDPPRNPAGRRRLVTGGPVLVAVVCVLAVAILLI
jgi:hypothetical protein